MKKLLILTLVVGCILSLGINNEANAAKTIKTQETKQEELSFEELLKLADLGDFEAQNKIITICYDHNTKNCVSSYNEKNERVTVCSVRIKKCSEIESLALRYAEMGNPDIQYELGVTYKKLPLKNQSIFLRYCMKT